MGNTYMVIEQQFPDGSTFAFVHQWHNCNNLVDIKGKFPAARTIMICETRKRAREIAVDWNECAKRNGTYLYS